MNLLALTQQAQRTNEGFSYNLNSREFNPSKGYMVSRQGFERVVTSDLVSAVRDYVLEFASELVNHPDNFIGCWYSEGRFILDISVNIASLKKATEFAINNKQLAIWDCANLHEIEMPLRACSCCGSRVSEVYVFADGDHYACSDACAESVSRDHYSSTWAELSTDIDDNEEEITNQSFYYTELL